MFTLKYRHSLARLRRRGIAAANAEILEKVIAYNLVHLIKREKKEKSKLYETPFRGPSNYAE
ncbi:MAG: hypothetical protein K9L78_01435 [Victivallales bacterium]|nr:hypothetical protein [Victivallales bacterium]MCF7888759.1 hypothetical protein [Victivallales bacterium]